MFIASQFRQWFRAQLKKKNKETKTSFRFIQVPVMKLELKWI